MDERRRREVLRELSANTGMDFGDLGDDLVAASAAVVQAGGPGALETAPPVDTGPAPDYRTDPQGFVEWGFRTLDALTQPRQRQPEGLAADGMPVDAGGGPRPGKAIPKPLKPKLPEMKQNVAENGVLLPPYEPDAKYGDQYKLGVEKKPR
jgi:hypothetical protein